jgi:hypothetical protein
MKFKIVLILSFISTVAFSQFSNFNTQKNWSMHKKEIFFGGGSTQFLGDLGGQEGVGKDYSLADINWRNTSFNFMAGYRYRFHPVWAVSTSLNFGRVKATDRLPQVNPGRQARNFEIRTLLASAVARIDYIIYANEKVGKRNALPGLKGMKDKNNQVFIFTGIGLAFFNPKGYSELRGEWVSLQPLKTEGQGYGGDGKDYKRWTIVHPFGVGVRTGLGRTWRLMIDVSYYKTYTDYMDDVSTTYFKYDNPNVDLTPPRPETLELADPTGQWIANGDDDFTYVGSKFGHGDKRGDNEKDAFFYLNVGFTKNVTYKSYVKGKPIKWKGVRAKF